MDGIDPNVIRDLGVIGLMALALAAWLSGKVHSDREFQDERADKVAAQEDARTWKDLAIELLRQTDRATSLAERVAKHE